MSSQTMGRASRAIRVRQGRRDVPASLGASKGPAQCPHPPRPVWSIFAPPHRGQLRPSPCLSRHFPQPRYLPTPCPACLSAPASASQCMGLWAGPASVPPWLPKGGVDVAGRCQACWRLLLGGHRVGARRRWEGRGLVGSPARCVRRCCQAWGCPPVGLHAWLLL